MLTCMVTHTLQSPVSSLLLIEHVQQLCFYPQIPTWLSVTKCHAGERSRDKGRWRLWQAEASARLLSFLAQENNIALESCTFRIIFLWPKFMLLWGGMETTFPHHCQAFPFSFLVQHYCHGCGDVQGKFISSLCRLGRSLVWLTLRLGECAVAVLCGTALTLAACTSCRFETVVFSWWGIARVAEASVHLEQRFCPLGWIFHLSQKTRNHKLAK